jgi:putative ABC transport system substrate-binding protein
MPVAGFVNMGESKESAGAVAAFLQGLRETGFVEGQNFAAEYRWARSQ